MAPVTISSRPEELTSLVAPAGPYDVGGGSMGVATSTTLCLEEWVG